MFTGDVPSPYYPNDDHEVSIHYRLNKPYIHTRRYIFKSLIDDDNSVPSLRLWTSCFLDSISQFEKCYDQDAKDDESNQDGFYQHEHPLDIRELTWIFSRRVNKIIGEKRTHQGLIFYENMSEINQFKRRELIKTEENMYTKMANEERKKRKRLIKKRQREKGRKKIE